LNKDYYAFGMPMPGRSFSTDKYRYGFNGMEKDDEIKGTGNSLDFGARLYDPRLGRWISPDPADQFRLSPYLAFANNPVLLVDPDGRWVPGVDDNGRITLTAEKGDNLKSMYSFFGDKGGENAKNYLPTTYFGEKFVAAVGIETEWKVGKKVAFNTTNAFSKGTKWYAKEYEQGNGDNLSNTTCHGSALLGSRGQSLTDLGGEGNYLNNILPSVRDDVLSEQYDETSRGDNGSFNFKENGVLGQTLITVGEGHSATYFGTDNDGNDYFLSKHSKGGYTIDQYDDIVNMFGGKEQEVKAFTIKQEYQDKPLTNDRVKTK
jgi:RHS repeat-associated protein